MQTQTKNPIFLVGCPRSGTTLLQQMLDAHPAVAIAPETFFIRRFWLQREYYGNLSQDMNYHQLIEDIIAIPEFKEMGLDASNFREAAWSNPRDYPSVFCLLFEQFAHKRKVNIVGEKTPNHLLYMPILQEFFPSARFIHIIRDPRSVVKSWRKVPWSNGSLARDAEVWRRYMNTARLCPASIKASLFNLYYEQLVTAPEENLQALCHFLRLKYDPAMMNYHHKESGTINTIREPWKANAKNQISQASLGNWQTELSPRMVREIETVVWPEMKYLGYKVKTNRIHLLLAKGLIGAKHKLRLTFRRIKHRISLQIK